MARRRALRLLGAGAAAGVALAPPRAGADSAAASVSEADRGFAGLGAAADGYAAVTPGRPIVFPRDYGQHPDYRIEWWYLTANLETAAGAPMGVQWTLFRQALSPGDDPAAPRPGWRSPQIWMAHAAATSGAAHEFAERVARGGAGHAGAVPEPFSAWLDDWAMEGTGEGIQDLRLRAAAPRFDYDLTLRADGPIALQGQNGYSVKAPARDGGAPQASYYYSQPHYRASGRLRLRDDIFDVTGRAWLDREWSSQPLSPDQLGWDWVSLHLSSGEKLMAFRLRRRAGPPDLAANWIGRGGLSRPLAAESLSIEPVEGSRDARGAPLRWRIAARSEGLEIVTDILNPDVWQGERIQYFEGPITATGTHAGGGYLEMTGYGADA
ncbi:MAG: lipocalin-like domain-containing protein [Pseudomonadota bacterium]